jgi:hypothetical protein
VTPGGYLTAGGRKIRVRRSYREANGRCASPRCQAAITPPEGGDPLYRTSTQRRSELLVATASHKIISLWPVSKVGKVLGASRFPAAT